MGKMKIMGLSLLLLFVMGWAAQAQTGRFPMKDIPPEGKSLVDFVPQGWTV